MREKSNPRDPNDFHHDRFTQISESHCGLAVVQMLLHNLGIEMTQEEVVEADGASEVIEQLGMRVDQLHKAVSWSLNQANGSAFYASQHWLDK